MNLNLRRAGSVIHRVIDVVDSGDIIKEDEISIEGMNLDEIYSSLHSLSVDQWCSFLKEILK